jgi:hypothetical protein
MPDDVRVIDAAASRIEVQGALSGATREEDGSLKLPTS